MAAADDALLARAVAALPPGPRDAAERGLVGAAIADARHLLAANDRFLDFVRQDAGGALELPLSWMRMTPPEHVASDARAMAQARVAGVSEPYAKEYQRSDGGRVPILIALGLVADDPLPLFVLAAAADDPDACAAVAAWTTATDADLRARVAA